MYVCKVIKQVNKLKDMAREIKMKKTTYLRINSDGRLFTSSKEPKEGYSEFENKAGVVSYRKLFAGTEFGKITQLGISEVQFTKGPIKFLTITVENESNRDVLQVPLKNTKGGLNSVVKKFIAVLPNIDFSRTLTLSSSRKENASGFGEDVIFVNYVDDNGQIEKGALKFALKFGKDGNVPGFETRDGIDGIEYDFTKQDKFLYDELLTQLERFKNEKVSVDSEPVAEHKEPEAKKNPVKNNPVKSKPESVSESPKIEIDEDDDDLPF